MTLNDNLERSTAPRRASWRKAGRESLVSLLFCAPAVLLYVGLFVLPAMLGFAYSLTDWSGWNMHPHFVGLANYHELLGDELLRSTIAFTLFETVLIVLFFTFGAMVLAVLLDRLRIMKGLIRGLFFYPYILSILVVALIFKYLANYQEGMLNITFRSLHLGGWAQDWMADPKLVPYFVFAVVAWSGLGFFTTLYLANLQTIPAESFEAAQLDGAGPVAIFRTIQFPLLIPTITTTSVLALITGINLFGQIIVTTEGGPGYRTFTIGYYIFQAGVMNSRQGYAAAISFATFVALVIIAVIQVKLLRRKEVEL